MLTNEQVTEIFNQRVSGATLRELGKQYELSHEGVAKILKRDLYADVQINPAIILAAAKGATRSKQITRLHNIAAVAELRLTGRTQTEIAEQMGVNQATISRWLKAFDAMEE